MVPLEIIMSHFIIFFHVFGLKAIFQSYFSLLFSEINQQIYQLC